jgi:hypothetical protein
VYLIFACLWHRAQLPNDSVALTIYNTQLSDLPGKRKLGITELKMQSGSRKADSAAGLKPPTQSSRYNALKPLITSHLSLITRHSFRCSGELWVFLFVG